MRAQACTGGSAESARRILRAFQAADLPALEDALERSAVLLPPPAGLAADEAERRELLETIVSGMRRGLDGMRHGMSRRVEGAEALIALLAHLARTPPRPLPLRAR